MDTSTQSNAFCQNYRKEIKLWGNNIAKLHAPSPFLNEKDAMFHGTLVQH